MAERKWCGECGWGGGWIDHPGPEPIRCSTCNPEKAAYIGGPDDG